VPGITYREVGPDATEADLVALRAEALTADGLLLAAIVKPAAWHAYGLRPEQQRFVEEMLAARPEAVLVVLGHDRALAALPAALRITAWSDVPASQEAAAQRAVEAPDSH
jgi:hypothetical protein